VSTPSFLSSIRFRLAFTYTVVIFALAVAVVGIVNLALSQSLRNPAVTSGTRLTTIIDPATGRSFTVEREVELQFLTLEELVSSRAIGDLRRISVWVLLGLFPASVLVGWFVANRALRPIGEIAGVAKDISQTDDLTRRIDLIGPDDELMDLADTFDAMLSRIEEGVKTRRAFVQDMSHELRNPLAVMATNLDVVLGDDDAGVEDFRSTSEIVRRAVDRTARTVDDLVLFARDEVPQTKRSVVDLEQVLDEVLDEHRGAIGERGLTVRRVGAGAEVSAERRGLKRAVGNLVNNAVRLAHPGTTLSCGSGRTGAWAWIGVEDQGPGLDPRDHEQVFRRFWSGDSSSIGGEDRSGLGLAIVRQVAESHGGTATVRSSLGLGAEFVIWLPTTAGAERSEVTRDGVHPAIDVMGSPPAG
jgi:signal transduction histidine kinase